MLIKELKKLKSIRLLNNHYYSVNGMEYGIGIAQQIDDINETRYAVIGYTPGINKQGDMSDKEYVIQYEFDRMYKKSDS